MTRVIGIVSGKGGVGKTTVAVNLGAALASRYRKDVVLVDCNITTSHLGMYMGMYYYPISLNNVLSGDVNIEKAVYDYSVPGLKIIPASLSLDDLSGVNMEELKRSVKDLFGSADIILLDAAPGFGKEAIEVIKASDEIIYVMTPFVPSLMDVVKCHHLAEQLGVKSLGIVMSMVGEGRHELSAYEVEQLTELPVISRVPRDKSVLRSLANKVSVIDLYPKSKAGREFMRLAANIAGHEYNTGLVSRILRRLGRRRSDRVEFAAKTGIRPTM